MADPRRGKWLSLSPARRMVDELLHHAKKVPSLPLSKRFHIAPALEARRGVRNPPSWTAIFMRAYGLVAREFPELRRCFVPWPWKHLYEHPMSECAILVEREWGGENVVLTGKLRAPELRGLAEIQDYLLYLRDTPVWDVGHYRRSLRVGRYPGWLRRLLFWQSLYLSGAVKCRRFGTFMISSMGTLGVEQMHPLTTLTTYLTFGPISDAGKVEVKVIYDHRVVDARTVARALNALEDRINVEMAAELAEMSANAFPLKSR
jgi:hypothetical protein